MSEHEPNLNYDKHTGEILYDGVKEVDSDIRELFLSTLTSKKKKIMTPRVGSGTRA